MNKADYALESFKNVQDLIKFADQKASAIIIIIGLIFSAFTPYFEKLKFSDSISIYMIITFIIGSFTIIFVMIVLYYTVFKVLKPRAAKKYSSRDLSTFYFEHLCKEDRNLHNEYEKISNEKILKDVIDQQIEVSNILVQKNQYLSKSFIWLFVAIISSIFFIFLSIQL